MTQKYQLGFFARIFRNIKERKELRVIQTKEVLIGQDEVGNKYFEKPPGFFKQLFIIIEIYNL